MSVDLQVVMPQEIIPVSLVRPVPGLPVRTLDITGQDFRSVDEVLINEISSPDVVILSKTRLLAQVPDVLKTATISSVSVVSNRLVLTNKSFIRFRLSQTPSKVRGILRLVQLFLKILFTTPGTDIFTRKIGGAALRSLGQTFGHDEGSNILSNMVIAVDQTARQIIQIQGRDPSIPTDERLLSARITQAGFNRNEGALNVSVEVLSQAGRNAVARLEL